MASNLNINHDALVDFCKRHQIKRLSLFGSVLREDFRPESDVDFLVEFEPDAAVGLIKLAQIEIELSNLIGRKADMRSPDDLSRYFRDEVLSEAQVQYAA